MVMVLVHRKVEVHAVGFCREHRVGVVLGVDRDDLKFLHGHSDLNHDGRVIFTRVALLDFVQLHQLVLVVGLPNLHGIRPRQFLWGLRGLQLGLAAVLADDPLQLPHSL